MFEGVNIKDQLTRLRLKTRKEEDELITEARRILHKDLFAEKKILENLGQYNRQVEVVDEEDVDSMLVFTNAEIKQIAVMYRLKFLDSGLFKNEIPYEAVLKIKEHDGRYYKELKQFRILAPHSTFLGKEQAHDSILFVKTNYDNYYLLHRWGKKLGWIRRLAFWPLRRFETLFLTVLCATLLITLLLPTPLITLDSKATYWSGYRAAAFFHLLIFNMGVTVYFTFAFALNFSSSVWNRLKDFE